MIFEVFVHHALLAFLGLEPLELSVLAFPQTLSVDCVTINKDTEGEDAPKD